MTNALPGRRHNREEDSPEALRRSIDTLALAVDTLNQRLDEATLRLDDEIYGARNTTRQLATEVGRMGDVLVRRVEAATSPAVLMKRRRTSVWPLALAFTFGSMLAAVALILFSR